MRAVSISRVICLVCIAFGSSPVAWADDCLQASEAAIAQAKVPHAVTHVMTEPGKPGSRMELIFIDDKAFTKMNGAWSSMPYPTQQQIDTVMTARSRTEKTPHTCEKVANQTINGEAASLYVVRTEVPGKATEGRIWISDKTGLPLKSEVHLSSGTVIIDDFQYNNITAPPGVK